MKSYVGVAGMLVVVGGASPLSASASVPVVPACALACYPVRPGRAIAALALVGPSVAAAPRIHRVSASERAGLEGIRPELPGLRGTADV